MSHAKRQREEGGTFDLEDSPPPTPTAADDSAGTSRAARLASRAAQRRRIREAGTGDASPIQLAGEDDVHEPFAEEGRRRRTSSREAANDVDDGVDDDDVNADPDDSDEGEDLMENMERDYQRIDVLDTYGTDGIDNREYGAIDENARRAADRELDRRDQRNDGFYGTLDAVETDEDEEARTRRRGGFFANQVGPEGTESETNDDDLDRDDALNLEAFDVPLREWISKDRTRREIQRKFRVFLRHFTSHDESNQRTRHGYGTYEQKIRAMCASNMSTLQVSYQHLMDAEPVLALWLVDAPADMLLVFNEAATRHTVSIFPSYASIKSEIHVRIAELPILDSLRDLRRSHLDCFVKVHGVVTRRSAVYPQLQVAYYTCVKCKHTQGPFRVEGLRSNPSASTMPDSCPNNECEGTHFRLNSAMSQYRNVQRVNLQETPGSVPPGRVPRSKEVLLADDLIDIARPGEEVEVTGVFEHVFDTSLTIRSGFPVFSTFISANHIARREDASSTSNLSEFDIQRILDLARDPKLGLRIAKSIAPSIYGHDFCKMALAMSLFGGVPKNVNGKHRIRGDVNVLLLGDPGTAKSQLLKYAEYTAPRAVYSTGKGASAVGLTASVHKDPITKEWTLEGGALVLADKGVALIDEFDKMNEKDRTSIHEAMEQQSISVSKAGIVTSLQARCAVIAAANPIGGRYDSSNTLADNVELTDPILQRFDILCVLQDIVDPVADERLATFVTRSHMQSAPTRELSFGEVPPASDEQFRPDVIPQDLLRKYIQYARTHVRPVLRGNAFDQEKIASLYVSLRRESAASGGVPIAVRHVESIMRMAEAHAKMHLRDYVRDDDVDVSISMMLKSFISAQKFTVRRALERVFSKFTTSNDDRAYLLLNILQEMFRKEQMYQIIRLRQKNLSENTLATLRVPVEELEGRARERRIYDLNSFLTSIPFREAGYVYDETRKIISRNVT